MRWLLTCATVERVSLGLLLDISNHRLGRASRLLERCPVFLGRDATLCACVLEDDEGVSSLHASLDIRNGRIFVKDVQSATGTYVRGLQIEPGAWTELGPLGEAHFVHVGTWTVRVMAQPLERDETCVAITEVAYGAGDPTLQMPAGPAASQADTWVTPSTTQIPMTTRSSTSATRRSLDAPPPPVAAILAPMPALVAPAGMPPDESRGSVGAPLDIVDEAHRLNALLEDFQAQARPFHDAFAAEFEGANKKRRAQLLDMMRVRFPELARSSELRPLLQPIQPSDTRATGSERATTEVALAALQDLARMLGNREEPRTSAEIQAFVAKLKIGVSELLTGPIPLLSVLARFEEQMAPRPTGFVPYPKTPTELARALFDWRNPTDDAVRALRSSFGDLTTHQIGTFSGLMKGVQALLAELSPAAILAAWREARKPGLVARVMAFFARRTSLWTTFEEGHRKVTSDEQDRLRHLFGSRFAAELSNFGHRLAEPPFVALEPATVTGAGQAAPTIPDAQHDLNRTL